MEINELKKIKNESNRSLCLIAIYFIGTAILYFKEFYTLAIFLLIFGLYFLVDKRYWDIKYHLFKIMKK